MKECKRGTSKIWSRLLGYLAVAVVPTLVGVPETSAQSPPASYADPPYVLTGAISLPNNEKITSFDISTGAPIAGITNPISTGPSPNRADEMCYDPADKILAVVNNADDPPFITFISTVTKLVLGKISFDGTVQNGTPVPKATNGAE